MHISEKMRSELDYFRRLHEQFTVDVNNKKIPVKDTDDKILYMLLSASVAMDISEEGLFENFIITDKQITNKPEIQLDAYAFIDTDTPDEKHLHLFQYKLFEEPNKSASPVDVKNFVSLMNDLFVHPELRDSELNNPVFRDIENLLDSFTNRRSRKFKVKCNFITNAYGIGKSNQKTFDDLLGKFEYDKHQRGFGIQIYGEKEILELLNSDGKIKTGKETIQVIVDGINTYRFEDNANQKDLGLPEKIFIGICNVNELIRLQNKYHHNQLYSENIRLYLGDRAAVNKDIIQTITSPESIWFAYMNNGISMICDDMQLGAINKKKQVMDIELTDIQIVNGCQTVNALYSARYGEDTKNKFNSSNIMIKIYQINPSNSRFKQHVIKATNNQNAVKTYSLLANDPIQIEIQRILKKLGYLYDRKGEARLARDEKTVSMVQAALAYRAVFEYGAQKLRARIGQSRVFNKDEYERIYHSEFLESPDELNNLSLKLLTGFLILDNIRQLINQNDYKYIERLPIIRKSAYYIAGLYYAVHMNDCEKFIIQCLSLMNESSHSEKNQHIVNSFVNSIGKNFDGVVKKYQQLFDTIKIDKTDIDNLLKSKKFGDEYENFIKNLSR